MCFSCSGTTDVIKAATGKPKRKRQWFPVILWIGCSGSKAEGISGWRIEVIGQTANWVSWENGTRGHVRNSNLLTTRKDKWEIFSSLCMIWGHLKKKPKLVMVSILRTNVIPVRFRVFIFDGFLLTALCFLSYGHGWTLEYTERKGKKNPLRCVFSVAVNQLWSQELIDLFPLKIHQVEWDWRQSLGSVNMGPRWPGGIWTAPQVQWSERCVLWPRAPWKGLRLGRSARAKPPTHQRICASLCQDHGPATCQPLGWIHVLAGQWKISINHYPKPPIQWQKIPAVNVLSFLD